MKKKTRKMATYLIMGVLLLATVYIAGCVRFSNGTWMVKEAPLPEGWPEMTPVGEVEVKTYPLYRAAVVDDSKVVGEMKPMFTELFQHIKRNDISMTTPVEMGYRADGANRSEMTSMAFIYRRPGWGETGAEGRVDVRDIEPQMMASIGVRGNYTAERFESNLNALTAWIEEHADSYRPVGPPRYLGYNGPFTLPFMRYGEVQMPVEPTDGGE